MGLYYACMSEIDQCERASIAAVLAIPNVGHAAVRRLKKYLRKHESDWREFWVMSRNGLLNVGLSEKQIDSIFSFKNEHTFTTYYESVLFRNISVVLPYDAQYPPLLRNVPNAPAALFMKGELSESIGTPIAIIGTRQMTAYGKFVTETIVKQLVECGLSTVSGGMYGVDMTVHQATLAAGGQTRVILGHGFDHIYPAGLAPNHQELLSKGAAFYSPFAPETEPSRKTFPIRNAVVAGSAAAIIVTEAALKSGSHITAQCGLEQGKSIFAVPGPLTNPYSAGTSFLLQQGAALYTNVRDFMAELGPQLQPRVSYSDKLVDVVAAERTHPDQFTQHAAILDAVRSGLTTMQTLQGELNIELSQLSRAISQLELTGKLRKMGGQLFLVG